MGQLYKVKVIHTITGVLCALLFVLSVESWPALFIKPKSFFQGFVQFLPVIGTVIALLFTKFKNTFILPVLLSVLGFVFVFLSEPFSPVAFLLPFTVLFIPYAAYFYKYRDFGEMLSVLRWVIPAALLVSWQTMMPFSNIGVKDFNLYITAAGVGLMLIAVFKPARFASLLTIGLLSATAGFMFLKQGMIQAGFCQFYFIVAGTLSFDSGKAHIFTKETTVKLLRAKLLFLLVCIASFAVIVIDVSGQDLISALAHKKDVISGLLSNGADV